MEQFQKLASVYKASRIWNKSISLINYIFPSYIIKLLLFVWTMKTIICLAKKLNKKVTDMLVEEFAFNKLVNT